jgi:hypothetical protein
MATATIETAFGSAAVDLAQLRIPTDAEFADDEDYLADKRLVAAALGLAERHPAKFGFLRNVDVLYRWRRHGGRSQGRERWGSCAKLGGLAKHCAGAEFAICLAADHCREAGLGPRELEALLFHEMSHIDYDDEADKPVVRAHDVEMFLDELAEYGTWRADLRRAKDAFEQLPLAAAAD